MVNISNKPAKAATKPIAILPLYNSNSTPFQNGFLNNVPVKSTPQLISSGRPYTRLDAFTTGIILCIAWLVVLALIYLGISKYNGGPGVLSLVVYLLIIALAGYLLRKVIADYFKHAIRLDLLTY